MKMILKPKSHDCIMLKMFRLGITLPVTLLTMLSMVLVAVLLLGFSGLTIAQAATQTPAQIAKAATSKGIPKLSKKAHAKISGKASSKASGKSQHGPPPALVRVGKVKRHILQPRWRVSGQLAEVRRSVVAAEQTGRIVSVDVEEGDIVQGGQTKLAQIDDVFAHIALQRVRALLALATAKIDESQARLDRANSDLYYLEQLQKKNSAKPKEVADAHASVREWIARLAGDKASQLVAKADLEQAKEACRRLAVVAPFEGIVTRKVTEVGQWVTPGSPIVEIISSKQIDALIDVPENKVNALKKADVIDVIVEPLKLELKGHVVAVVALASSIAKTFPVKIRLDNPQGQLKAGMSVIAFVPAGVKKETLTVPRDAVVHTPTGTLVWCNIHGRGMPIRVALLFGVGDRYAVKSLPGGLPLSPHMQVVIEGAERLFPSRPLKIMADLTPTGK